jgi:hypothetical protein
VGAGSGSVMRPSSNNRVRVPLNGNDLAAAVTVLVAEYTSLREEIGRHQEHQKEILQFGYAILPITGTIAVAILGRSTADLRPYTFGLLAFPLIYGLLAALFTDRTFRLMWVGDYLHNHLRPRMVAALGLNVWQWEEYRRTSRWFGRPAVMLLDKARWLAFIGPSLGCLLAFVVVTGLKVPWWQEAWFVIDVIVFFLTVWLAFFFVHEAAGVPDRDEPQLPELQRRA